MHIEFDRAELLRPTLGLLQHDYSNAWRGLTWLFHFDGRQVHPTAINFEELIGVLESFDSPSTGNQYKDYAGLQSAYEIETFLDRCRVIATRDQEVRAFPLDQIEASGVLKTLDDSVGRVNESLRAVNRVRKMRFSNLTFQQAAEAMTQDAESIAAINAIRSNFQQLVDLHATYKR